MVNSLGLIPIAIVFVGVFYGTVKNHGYRALFGLFPLFCGSQDNWNFTFEDLYDEQTKSNLKGQTALVTGANSGIGYEVSLALARNGVIVTMACRNEIKCLSAATQIRSDPQVIQNNQNNESIIQILIMDTSSLASVKQAAEAYKEQRMISLHHRSLDMLFLNAGVSFAPTGIMDESVTLTQDGVEVLFATNVLGHHLLYKILEPLLLASKTARVVLTSSSGSFITFRFKVATTLEMLNNQTNQRSRTNYGHTKLAQIVWAKALTKRLSVSHPTNNMYINAAHPGAVNTNIWFKQPIPILYIDSLRSQFMWTPAEGALTILYLAVATEALINQNIRGKYFHPQSQEIVNPLALDETLQEKFWDFCDELVKDFL